MSEYSTSDMLIGKVVVPPSQVIDTLCREYKVSKDDIKLQGRPYNEDSDAARALHCISGVLSFYNNLSNKEIGLLIGTYQEKIQKCIGSFLAYEEIQAGALNLTNHRDIRFYQIDPRDEETLADKREPKADYQKRLAELKIEEAVKKIVEEVYRASVQIDTSNNFITQVCAIANNLFEFRYPISIGEIREDKRDKQYDIVRKALYYLLVEAGLSKTEIGKALHKDHSSVIQGYSKMLGKLGHVEKPRRNYRRIDSFIYNLPEEDRGFLDSLRESYEEAREGFLDKLMEAYWRFPFDSHEPTLFLSELCRVASYITGQDIEASELRTDLRTVTAKKTEKAKRLLDTYNFAVLILREMFHMEFTKLGEFFNKKDHTTVLHAYRKVSDTMLPKIEDHRKNVSEEDIKKFVLDHIESTYLASYNPQELIEYICELVNSISGKRVTTAQIKSRSQDPTLAIARDFVYYVLKEKTKLRNREIKTLVNRDNTTVGARRNSVKNYKKSLEDKPKTLTIKEVDETKDEEQTTIKYRYIMPELDRVNPFSTVQELDEVMQRYAKEYRTVIGQQERKEATKNIFVSQTSEFIEELSDFFSHRAEFMQHHEDNLEPEEREIIVSIDGNPIGLSSGEVFIEDNNRFLRARDELLYPTLRKLESL